MNCGDPGCTGVHGRHRPMAEWCPAARECKREADRRQRATPGTYAYDAAHGIGEAGEVGREADRRQRATPGTYEYDRSHGIGRPGAVKQFKGRRAKRRQANDRDLETLRRLRDDTEA